MLRKIFSQSFRNEHKDSFGRNWIFNWHCLDHVGYKHNPRRRDLGYHKIFDHYNRALRNFKGHSDTESILYYLIENGIQGVTDFNGIFAFALVDKK
jgi:hypothetical protein